MGKDLDIPDIRENANDAFTVIKSRSEQRHINPDGSVGGVVYPETKIGENVYIGFNAFVWYNATIPDNTRIESGDMYLPEDIQRMADKMVGNQERKLSL